MDYVILTHGGFPATQGPVNVGRDSAFAGPSDGCAAAAEAAREVLDQGGEALAAAVRAALALEDFSFARAGAGAHASPGDRAVAMDAAVMASDGRFGAVACIERVEHPVAVAARVLETPHLLLAGAGATAFARQLGFPDHDPPPGGAPDARARAGAVVRDRHGRFAAAGSGGGAPNALRGRVGEVPLLGAGLYAGPSGAVVATGAGEEIARRLLAKTVYDWLDEGIAPARAAQRALAMFPDVIDLGLLVVGRSGQAVASNRAMASASLAGGGRPGESC